jgi:uncharacterized hydrophobic protein (TIGR00271 family)
MLFLSAPHPGADHPTGRSWSSAAWQHVRVFALRLICPPPATDAVVALLHRHPAATHLAVLRGAALEPLGDVVLVDLAREAVSEVLAELRSLPGGGTWAYALENVDTTLSSYAAEAERVAPGLGVDAVVWEEVQARTHEESELSGSFLALMVLATLIAAVGVLLDSPVLIVGAMVVGPEFGPVAGLTVALVQRRLDLARRSLTALAVGFPLAIVAALLMTRVAVALGELPASYAGERRPLTEFISHPDGYAVLVALLAGVAGVVSLTSAKSAALVGVAVSVTTIPAAADVGVAAAAERWSECGGAAAQLTVNLVALVLAGVLTLELRRRGSRRSRSRAART